MPLFDLEGIIPAYAGSTRKENPGVIRGPDHPRIRGEHVDLGDTGIIRVGSSPHTRGAPWTNPTGSARSRIIPAYAGSTSRAYPSPPPCGDHPRIRGEHIVGARRELGIIGSSPHTRGALAEGGGFGVDCRIIPAYAGSTGQGALGGAVPGDHPRIRGEHWRPRRSRRFGRGSSPHTRGAHERRRRRPQRSGIIPAYAGSTCSCRSSPKSWGDHPRIRGEHLQIAWEVIKLVGSSPHTRGALE